MTFANAIWFGIPLLLIAVVFHGIQAMCVHMLWVRRTRILDAEFELQKFLQTAPKSFDKLFMDGIVPPESDLKELDLYFRIWRKTLALIWSSGENMGAFSLFVPKVSSSFKEFIDNRFYAYVSGARAVMTSKATSSYVFIGECELNERLRKDLQIYADHWMKADRQAARQRREDLERADA